MKKLALCILLTISSSESFTQGNLIACYPFNGNANDESGQGHHGIVNGAVLTTDRFGASNSAYYFNGIQDFIDIGNFSTFTGSDTISLSVWIQPDQVKLQTLLFLMPDNFNDRFNAMAYYNHNGISSTIWDFGNCSTGGRLIQVGTVFSNLWQHWVFTISPVNGMKVYKNGVLNLSQASSSTLVNRNRNLWIGGGSDNSGAPFYFKGKIDDMRIYDREITGAEVADLFLNENSCVTTSLANDQSLLDRFRISFYDSRIKVKVPSGSGDTSFSLYDINGGLLYSKNHINGGEVLEICVKDKGLLIYVFKSVTNSVVGKLFPSKLR